MNERKKEKATAWEGGKDGVFAFYAVGVDPHAVAKALTREAKDVLKDATSFVMSVEWVEGSERENSHYDGAVFVVSY